MNLIARSIRRVARSVRPGSQAKGAAQARSNPLYHYTSSFQPEPLIKEATQSGLKPEPGFVTNFLGVRIRPQIMPSLLERMAGTVEAPPDPGNWHADIAEWGAAFHAIEKSDETFRMLELGCGWGCWMVNTGVVARRLGKKVELIGIEGDPDHIANADLTLRDNGFTESQFTLVHGVAGPKPGVALFPKAEKKGEIWNAEPVFYPDEARREELLAAGRHDELTCHTLTDLAGDEALDLLHVDIQGAEVEFVRGNFDHMTRTVRRVLIGTHSRPIEGQLTDHFLEHGWRLEMDRPALSNIVDGRPQIQIDGVHLWRNPALTKDE